MQLACHDKNTEDMLTIISMKEKDLHDKYIQIKQSKEDNDLLDYVLEDYKTYYNEKKNEKTNQYNSLDQLTQYLDDIALNEEIDHTTLVNLKKDQKDILKEMRLIKNKLD